MRKLIALILIAAVAASGCRQAPAVSSADGSSKAGESQSTAEPALENSSESSTESSKGTTERLNSNHKKSRELYSEEYAVMDEFDIGENQKLAAILMANYLDMQDRIDIDTLEKLSPVLKKALSDEATRKSFINDLLQCSDYRLHTVEDAEMTGNKFSFNTAYSIDYGTGEQLLAFRKFNYVWKDGVWEYDGDEVPDPEAAEKPNYALIVGEKEKASQKTFGTDNLMTLFDFDRESYRDIFSEESSSGTA